VDWKSLTWEQFERALSEYRDREYLGRSRSSGENAYLQIVTELAHVSMAERAQHVDSLVLFLNRWNCHFPSRTAETRKALREWLAREGDSLEALGDVSLIDPAVAAHREECEQLYASLISLRDSMNGPRIPTMGDAAASKILHVMLPSLFVMWDKEIKRGGWQYGDFLLQMHTVALRLRDELAPEEARADVAGYLERRLGYPVRKTLAKYIDEYNWWVAWGLGTPQAAG
jgi:hypothetical protein